MPACAGVIGYYCDPDEKRILVLYSSVKLAMFCMLDMLDAYSEGGMQEGDFTYKIMKEKMPMLVRLVPYARVLHAHAILSLRRALPAPHVRRCS